MATRKMFDDEGASGNYNPATAAQTYGGEMGQSPVVGQEGAA